MFTSGVHCVMLIQQLTVSTSNIYVFVTHHILYHIVNSQTESK